MARPQRLKIAAMDIRDWLEQLGLGRYADAFAASFQATTYEDLDKMLKDILSKGEITTLSVEVRITIFGGLFVSRLSNVSRVVGSPEISERLMMDGSPT